MLKQIPLADRVAKLPRRPLIALVLAGLIGAGGFWFYQSQASQKQRRRSAAMTVPAKVQDLDVRITASGTVTPIQSVNVSPKNSGRLVALYVDQGIRVKQGQVIARMEDDDIRAQVAQSRASLAQAEAQYQETVNGNRPEQIAQAQAQVESARSQAQLAQQRLARNRNLYQQGAITKDAYDAAVADQRNAQGSLEAAQKNFELLQRGSRVEEVARTKAAVAQAQAQLESSLVQLRDTEIRAPFDGIITQKYASVGAFVTPTTSASTTSSATSTSIVAIASELEVIAKVPETSISQIRPGQAVNVTADAYPGQTFKGRVRLVAPEAVVDTGVTSFQVRIALETGQAELKSGMNTDLVFLGRHLDNAIVVPTVAIVTQKGKTGVLVPDEQRQPQFKPVTIGAAVGDQVQIVSGLNPGEPVFVYLPKSPQSGEEGRRSGGASVRVR